jgi:hypothetical protein
VETTMATISAVTTVDGYWEAMTVVPIHTIVLEKVFQETTGCSRSSNLKMTRSRKKTSYSN